MPYRPFEQLDFNDRTCFISGEKDNIAQVTVFPDWVLSHYELSEKPFKLLDESITTYSDIRVPASENTRIAISGLEEKVRAAFMAGYDAVAKLDETALFQWIAKLVYGMIHYEVRSGIRQQAMAGERMIFSQSLVHRFSNFHLMLQSMINPTLFEGALPWTIRVFRVNNAPATFTYRDEINTLTFSLRLNDFGIIACLQDNGANAGYHQGILEKIGQQELHPIQFEEISARFFYSAYLFNRLPEYLVLATDDATFIESMPLQGSKPLFDAWQNKIYGQVLENFWKPWGFLLLEIIKDPEHPMSFLLEDDSIRESGTIALPLSVQ